VLSDNDLMNVQQASRTMSRPVTILVNSVGTNDPFEKNLLNVARQIAGVSSEFVRIEDGRETVLPDKPSITLSSPHGGNISYAAVPEGLELSPFLDALMWLGQAKTLPSSDALESLGQVSASADVLVLIAPVCPHCPSVVRKILSMAVRQPLIKVTVADAVQFPDLADRYKVKSTPTVIINDRATLVGQLTEEQIVDHLLPSEEIGALSKALSTMIQAGRAEDAGDLLCRERKPEAVVPIYVAPEFSLRMGALVAMEEALEKDPRSLDPIVDELTGLLFHQDAPLRGDTAELLGKIGNQKAVPALRKAADDPDPDVREAVEEALEVLEK
jgi:thioredoxin-like negative regulator of GroEL